MRPRQIRWTRATILTACALTACGASIHRDREADSTAARQSRVATPVDATRMLDLSSAVNPANVAARGTCIPIDVEGRSRLIYLILPAESSYVRLTVVARPRKPIEMVDLVRGIPDGRIWSATLDGPHRPVTARLYSSASDKAPVTDEWPDQDLRSQQLLDVAGVAIGSPCVGK